jgi:hypothetical protein
LTRSGRSEELTEAARFMDGLDALAHERAARRDAHWLPEGDDVVEAVERLGEERRARMQGQR